jgi:HEAT repeat protein/predicted Ser/Thr protein kinase
MDNGKDGSILICPSCDKQLRVGVVKPGSRYKCPACAGIITAPPKPSEDEILLQPSLDFSNVASEQTIDITPPAVSGAGGSNESIGLADESGARVPKKLGRYEIISEIARGGMGVVYQARDPQLGRIVALKVLLAGQGASQDSIARFIREARSAARLKHPGIVPVYDFGEVDGQHFFTMDYVKGRSLNEVAAVPGLTTRQSLEIILVTARALQFAHENGIIHRDLKPANILIDSKGAPVLTDFGLAKEVGDTSLSMTGTIFGTPAYMSPEQAQGRTSEIDGRSDVYSLGSVLYELLTGQQAFSGETVYDIITQVIDVQPPAPSLINTTLPADLSTICLKALEKAPARRYQSMRAMADDIQAYLGGQGINARPLTAVEKLGRFAARNYKSILWAVTGSVAAAVLVMVLWFYLGHDPLKSTGEMLASSDLNLRRPTLERLIGEIEVGRYKDHSLVKAEDLVIKMLKDSNTSIRKTALKFVGQRKLLRAARSVVAILEVDEKMELRIMAAKTNLKPMPGDLGVHLVDYCVKQAGDRKVNHQFRLACLLVVGRLGGMASRPVLVRLKIANRDDPAFCRRIDLALTKIAPRNVLIGFYNIPEGGMAFQRTSNVIDKLYEKDRELDRLIDEIEGTGKRKPVKVDPLADFRKRLSSEDQSVRLQAASDLGMLASEGKTSKEFRTACLELLLATMLTNDCEVALAAADSAEAIGAESLSDQLLSRVKDAKAEPNVRGIAAHLLGLMRVRSALQPIIAALKSEKNDSSAALMAEALGNMGVRKPCELLLSDKLLIGGVALRRAAANAMGSLRTRRKESLTALIKSVDDPDADVAWVVNSALELIAGDGQTRTVLQWRSWWAEKRGNWGG